MRDTSLTGRKDARIKCPKCGSLNVETLKTWNLTSPLPDAEGRITITIMGSMRCQDCGYTWRGVVSKIKVGGSSVEIDERKKIGGEEEGEERVKEIVLDIEDILKEG